MNNIYRLILALCILTQISIAYGQESSAGEQPKSWLIYQSEISKLWKIQNEFLDHHNEAEGGQLFQQIMFLKESYNLTEIPSLSTALLRKIPPQDTLTDKIRHPFYTMATELSPGHYTNDYFLCDFYADPAEWLTSAKYCFDGLKKELSSPSEQLVFLSKLSYQLFWAAFILVLFYVLLYIFKFTPFTIQYYSSAFYWISPVSYLFLMMIVSLLIMFTFGWLFFFAFFYVFFWRFPSIKEKILLFGLACVVMMVPFTLVAPALSKQFHTGINFDLINVDKTLQPAKFEEKIDQHTMQNQRDPYAHFVLGVLAKKVGNVGEAKRHFDISKLSKSDFVKTKVNLANLQYEFGDSTGAKEQYKKLISEYPATLPPYINLSQIYTHESSYLEGEEYLNKAKAIDENKFKKTSQSLYHRKGFVKLIYEELTPEDIGGRIYERGEVFQFQFLQFFSNYFPKYSPSIYYSTLICMILLSLIFQLTTHTRNFYFLYFNREKNLEKLTLVQLREYPNAYQKFAANLELRDRIFFITSILLPGFADFMEERLTKSVIYTFLLSFSISGYFIDMSFPRINDSIPWGSINLLVVILLYFINFIDLRINHGKKKN
jgi:tetratricopeptide (TPR) repeat protein